MFHSLVSNLPVTHGFMHESSLQVTLPDITAVYISSPNDYCRSSKVTFSRNGLCTCFFSPRKTSIAPPQCHWLPISNFTLKVCLAVSSSLGTQQPGLGAPTTIPTPALTQTTAGSRCFITACLFTCFPSRLWNHLR